MNSIQAAFDELISEYQCKPLFSYIMPDPMIAGCYFWVLDDGAGRHQWGNTPRLSTLEVLTDIRVQLRDRGWVQS